MLWARLLALRELKVRVLKLLREDEEFRYAVAGLIGLEEILKRLDRSEAELVKLREDMNGGFEIVEGHISAFRESLKGLLEREFGFRVEKWVTRDEDGVVFGYPSEVDVDAAVSNGKIILIEVSSHARASDIFHRRKANLYREKTGREPDKLIVVTPYMDEKALEAAKNLGMKVFTKI